MLEEDPYTVVWTKKELIDNLNKIAKQYGFDDYVGLQGYIHNLKSLDCLKAPLLLTAESCFHLLGEQC
jgi:hypothetical protein